MTTALSRLYGRTGDLPKAEDVLTNRLKADPKNLMISATLAPLYLTTGQIEDAKKLYRIILSERPNDVATLLGLAEIARAEKQWSEATDYVNRAREAVIAAPDCADQHTARRIDGRGRSGSPAG